MLIMMLFMARCADSPILENLSGLQSANARQRGRKGKTERDIKVLRAEAYRAYGGHRQRSYRVYIVCLQYSFRGYWGRGPLPQKRCRRLQQPLQHRLHWTRGHHQQEKKRKEGTELKTICISRRAAPSSLLPAYDDRPWIMFPLSLCPCPASTSPPWACVCHAAILCLCCLKCSRH